MYLHKITFKSTFHPLEFIRIKIRKTIQDIPILILHIFIFCK